MEATNHTLVQEVDRDNKNLQYDKFLKCHNTVPRLRRFDFAKPSIAGGKMQASSAKVLTVSCYYKQSAEISCTPLSATNKKL